MSDLITRLNRTINDNGPGHGCNQLLSDAANEIIRLRNVVYWMAYESANQPVLDDLDGARGVVYLPGLVPDDDRNQKAAEAALAGMAVATAAGGELHIEAMLAAAFDALFARYDMASFGVASGLGNRHTCQLAVFGDFMKRGDGKTRYEAICAAMEKIK